MGNHFSPDNPDAPFVIDELEINPFAFTDYLMVPLDGMCKFSLPEKEPTARPVAHIGNLLHPERIGIIGVSAKRRNFGRTILENIIGSGFDKDRIVILRDGEPDPSACAACRTCGAWASRWICSSWPWAQNTYPALWTKYWKRARPGA